VRLTLLCDDQSRADQAADQWRLLRGEVPAGETVRLTVRSGSMLPAIPVGAELEIAPVEGRLCRVGDVVVFRQGDRLVAHRLLFGWGEGAGAWFLQRGDGVSPLGAIRARTILGRVVAVRRPGGETVRLAAPEARLEALRLARRSLARIVLIILVTPARKVKGWLQRGNTGSASARS